MATIKPAPSNKTLPQSTTRDRPSSRDQQRIWWGLLFLSPWIIGFLVFYLMPMVASLVFTFTNFDLTQPDAIEFVGLSNWRQLFQDKAVGAALINTAIYAAIALPMTVIVPILFAAMLNAKQLWGKRWMRTLFYMPYMIPTVSAAFIWEGFLNGETGWLNMFIDWLNGQFLILNLPTPSWLFDPTWIYMSLFLISLWTLGNAFLITLASMQGVPTELYEAAEVDGANGMVKFLRITIPLISPVIFYNLVLTTIALFRYFDIPYMLKGSTGDPGGSTMFYNILLYRETFRFQKMGYGATLAWLLFILALFTTLILFATARYWVFYGNDQRSTR